MNESVFVCSLWPPVQTPKNQWQCLSSTVRWHRSTWRCRPRSLFSYRGSKSEESESNHQCMGTRMAQGYYLI